MLYRKIYIVFLFLCGMSFFTFAPLGKLPKAFHVVAIGLMFLTILLDKYFHNNEKRVPMQFSALVIFIMIGAFISAPAAYLYHSQPLGLSFWSNRYLFLFLFYFTLHTLKPDVKTLERILLNLAIIYFVFNIVQIVAFPKVFFSCPIWVRRGTISVYLPGLYFVILMYFYSFRNLTIRFSFKYFIFLLIFFAVFILFGNRNILGGVFLITLFIIIVSSKVKHKTLILISIVFSFIAGYFIFKDIITNLINLSTYQASPQFEEVRFKALRYFLTEFFPAKITYIIGNGQSNEYSAYGIHVRNLKINYGFYLTDIGIFGGYVKFGIFYLLGVVIIMYKVIFSNIPYEYYYIKDLFWVIALSSFSREGPFQIASSIVLISCILYMMDKIQFNSLGLTKIETT